MDDAHGGRSERSIDGQATAYLTLAALLCGFAFAGFVAYLSISAVTTTRVVAASLLLAAFVALLYCAFCMAALIRTRDLLDLFGWYVLGVVSMVAGGVLLLASVCVMAFAWARPLGYISLAVAAAFAALMASMARRLW